MGGTQSTRKLTIDNDDPTTVIKVTDSVIERLKGRNEEGQNIADRSGGAPSPPAGLPQPQQLPGMNPAYPPYMYEPRQTSLQVRQEKEQLLRTNDAYWQSRINKLEESHEQINKLMDQEYSNAVNEVKSNFPEMPVEHRAPVCLEGKKAVMECYKQYPNQPLRCSKEVQAFADCVDRHRSAIVVNRG